MDLAQQDSIDRFAQRIAFAEGKGVELRVDVQWDHGELARVLGADHVAQKRFVIDDGLNFSLSERIEEIGAGECYVIDVICLEILCGRAVSEGADVNLPKVLEPA